MGTKAGLLRVLEKNKDVYLSGEALAEALGVSRTAVWKAVGALQREGYVIDAVRNRGYRLSPETDILSVQGMEKYLEDRDLRLELLPTAASTNGLLRDRASGGAPEGTVLLAACQTAGRGRMGRSFYSPAETGIYMSLLLRPRDLAPDQAVRLTTLAAAAACQAIAQVSGKDPGIKWVNDIFLDGKKVGGILTEAALSLEARELEYVVLGIGLNVYAPRDGFPEELEPIAGAVFDGPQRDGKNRLAAAFLNAFFRYYRGETPGWTEYYREKSLVLGRDITVLSREGERPARALDLDDHCRLLVEYPDGTRVVLSSGEIRVKF